MALAKFAYGPYNLQPSIQGPEKAETGKGQAQPNPSSPPSACDGGKQWEMEIFLAHRPRALIENVKKLAGAKTYSCIWSSKMHIQYNKMYDEHCVAFITL